MFTYSAHIAFVFSVARVHADDMLARPSAQRIRERGGDLRRRAQLTILNRPFDLLPHLVDVVAIYEKQPFAASVGSLWRGVRTVNDYPIICHEGRRRRFRGGPNQSAFLAYCSHNRDS